MKDLKYLAAFSIPITVLFGIYFKGVFTFITPVYAFVIIPVLELIFPIDNSNIDEKESENLLHKKIFDWLLYLNLPVVYGLLFYALLTVSTTPSRNIRIYRFNNFSRHRFRCKWNKRCARIRPQTIHKRTFFRKGLIASCTLHAFLY